MNTNLTLRTTEMFGEVQADIYENNNNEMYMTARQLGECLGYSDPIRNINKIVSRHTYLKTQEFSIVVNLTTTNGKSYRTRVFNEDGIYEIAFLSNTDKAFEFRQWARKLLKSLRKGDLQLAKDNVKFSPSLFEAQLNQKLGLLQNNLLSAKPQQPNYWSWKKHTVSPLIFSVSQQLKIDIRTAYDLVYDRMFMDYGFDRSLAVSQFCAKYLVDSAAVIDAVADNPTYQQWFVFTSKDMLAEMQ